MKKVLILVVSSENEPYGEMIKTSLSTWDSVEVEGVDSMYYCGKSSQLNTNKVIHFPIQETYANMGYKALEAFQWALDNKEFDYIARVNSSCYVDKKQLIQHVQSLPDSELFSGIEASSQNGFQFLWGGGQYIISKDIIQKIVKERQRWNHSYMEDESLSLIAKDLGYKFHQGKACSINIQEEGWLLIGYGGESIEFKEFKDVVPFNNHFYRVKQDQRRNIDKFIMEELFKIL